MRTILLVSFLSLASSTGCAFVASLRPPVAVGVPAVVTAGAAVQTNAVLASTSSTQVTVNGRPASAQVSIQNGQLSMSAASDTGGASVSVPVAPR